MSRAPISLAVFCLLSTLPLAASSGETEAANAAFWGHICTYGQHRLTGAQLQRALAAAPSATCAPVPTGYHTLSSIGGTQDTAANLQIGYDSTTERLCFVTTGLAEAPVLRVGAGHNLSIQIQNTLLDSGTLNEVNCPIDTFGGEAACLPQYVFPEIPGADGTYYPIMANESEEADGTSNLHVHGLFVSPRQCSDEVINSTIYPANWLGTVGAPPPCQPSPDTLAYTYKLPPDHPAGVYWYHTHRHGQSEAETQMGLAGAIVVQDAGDTYRASIGVTDEVLMVTDRPKNACFDPNQCSDAMPAPRHTYRQPNAAAARLRAAQLRTAASEAPILDPRIDQVDQAGECAAGATSSLGGIELWTLVLNGAPVPETYPDFPPDSELLAKTMQPGQRQIFRLVNASADSFLAPQLLLSQNGVLTPLPLEVFARDGVGLADWKGKRHLANFDVSTTPLIVPPAGRLEFVVHAPPAGAELYLQSNRVYPGCGGNAYPARRLLLITAAGTPVDPGASDDSDLLINTPSLKTYFAKLGTTPTVHRTLVFSEYARGFTYAHTTWTGEAPNPYQYNPNATDFYITQVAADDGSVNPNKTALRPFTHSSAPAVVVHLHGAESVTEEWLVENSTLEIHAFHIHQIHFRDVTASTSNPDLEPILDTDVVPAAPLIGDPATGIPGAPGYVQLLMTFTRADIGEFVFHCHILEHEDNGMMAKIKVVAD